jgi:hypothetical protein
MASKSPLRHWIKRHNPFDRQTYLRDVSVMAPALRRPRSRVIQFYSSYRNIGNFTPVLGIQGMLAHDTDVWDMHQSPIDWDWVHRHYDAAVIGGAGLLNACFQPFWDDFAEHCRLPYVIWGIGVCLPHNEKRKGVSVETARRVFAGAGLANVRDLLTRDHYSLPDSVDISACPTIVHLEELRKSQPGRYSGIHKDVDVLHSIHTTLTESAGNELINRLVRDSGRTLRCTENLQTTRSGINDVLALYPRARTVVTTRLHGAIIAFGLRVPYIALSFDPKVRAFVELYGGGQLAQSPEHAMTLLAAEAPAVDPAPAVARSREFGARAAAFLAKATTP